jgi:hypothetical protein
MDEPKTISKETTTEKQADGRDANRTQHTASPVTDPTNPFNQEPAGDWVANERAAERSNNEPGLTDLDRKQRRW